MLDSGKIEEIIGGIDFHLRKIYEFEKHLILARSTLVEHQTTINKNQAWEIEKLKSEMNQIRVELQRRGLPECNKYELEYSKLVESLSQWPQAADPSHICTNEEKNISDRAKVITCLVICEDLQGKKFLDYGCGNDSVIKEVDANLSIGYDIKASENVVTDFEFVKQSGPYDVILLHDVLDHIENMTPVDALKQVKSVLKPNGRIYAKNHPWCSRHGGHLYQQINKAFLHLIFDEVELMRLGGFSCEHTLKVISPFETYEAWLNEAGLEIKSAIPQTSKVEQFFFEPSYVRERLLKVWSNHEVSMRNNMEIEFIEYTLTHQQMI